MGPTRTKSAPSFSQFVHSSINQPNLSIEQEQALHRRFLQGDKRAGDKLINAHTKLAIRAAKLWERRGMDFDDILSQGLLGMVKALPKYDVIFGTRVGTYLAIWMHAEIKDFIRKNLRMVQQKDSGQTRSKRLNISRIASRLRALHGHEGRSQFIERLEKAMGLPPGEAEQMLNSVEFPDEHLDASVGHDEGEGTTWLDMQADEGPLAEASLIERDTLSKQRAILERAIAKLSPREADILRRRRLNDPVETLEQVAEIYGVTRERIRQIEVKAYDKLLLSMGREVGRNLKPTLKVEKAPHILKASHNSPLFTKRPARELAAATT